MLLSATVSGLVAFNCKVISRLEFLSLRGLSAFVSANEGATDRAVLGSHRGVHNSAVPANSAKGIRLAARHGFSVVEIDVVFSRGLVPVVYHDLTFDRLGHISKRVDETDWREIRTLALKDGQSIMDVATFAALLAPSFEGIYFDIKGEGLADRKATAFIDALRGIDPATSRVHVIGGDYEILRAIERRASELYTGCEDRGVLYALWAGHDLVSVHYPREYSRLQGSLAGKLGLGVLTWTINDWTSSTSIAINRLRSSQTCRIHSHRRCWSKAGACKHDQGRSHDVLFLGA
jgi:glycerophosphoryl diester phosphodiesterase